MKKTGIMFASLTAGVLLTFLFLWTGALARSAAEPAGSGQLAIATATGPASDEGLQGESPWVVTGSDELPPAEFVAAAAVDSPQALPTEIPGETLVYFVPTDSDATATVVFLYNTDAVTHSVALRGYSYNGVLGYSLSISVGPGSLMRLASDSIAAAPPPSWATPAPIITNFTDFTYLASLSLPAGVKAEGYTVFNPGTGTVDPRADQGAVPLRFSTDPATVFLPAVQNNP